MGQSLKHPGGDGSGFIPEPGVERWLSAAGHVFGEPYAMAKAFENFDHADPNLREADVDETGDKERDGHADLGSLREERCVGQEGTCCLAAALAKAVIPSGARNLGKQDACGASRFLALLGMTH